MAEFYAAVTTNLGVSLSADLLTGEQLEFTKLVAGGGNYSEEDLARTELQKATSLRDQKQEFGFSAKEKVTDSCVLLKTLLSNEQLETGYRMTEIGIYAKKAGEEGDGILYSIAVAKEADYFPPYNGLAAVEIVEDYYISVSDAENVTIQTGRDTPVLAEEFEKFKEDVEKKFETIPKVVIGPEETEVEEKDVLLITKDGKIGEVKKDGVKYPLMVRGDNVLTDETHLLVSQDEKDKWNAKPDSTSPVNQNVVNFVMAAARSMILSGEDLETLFSKLARWLNDLKAVALSGSYNDLTNRPNLGNAASQGVANNDTTTQAGYVADARIVRQHGVEIDQINSDLGGCKISWDGSNFWAQHGSSKKKLGSPVPALIVNKVGISTTSNSKSYTAAGEGYVIVCEASWSNNVVTFSVMKNGSPISPSSTDGVSDRNKYIYCWSVPVKKGDTILASMECSAAADLYINMYAVIL